MNIAGGPRGLSGERLRLEKTGVSTSTYRQFLNDRCQEFISKGYRAREYFPHRIYYFPKCGPDAFKLGYRMLGVEDPNKHWELVLYGVSPAIDEFPQDLFFDDDVFWHQQQFGLPGQVATANLVVQGSDLFTNVLQSDLVQRISRRREYKTRVESVFGGWVALLLNGVLNFASEQGLKRVLVPTSDLAIRHTDPKRTVQSELFERIYDRTVRRLFHPVKNGDWWEMEMGAIQAKLILPERGDETVDTPKTICLCHDIERGIGHIGIDREREDRANQIATDSLSEMLRLEREEGIRATYSVVGCILEDVRQDIEADGHCIALHSYDHDLSRSQLDRCREVDYRIKGYRAPCSIITPELTDEPFYRNNFEWLSSSVNSLGFSIPTMGDRMVKIPVLFDDFELYKRGIAYPIWEKQALETIAENELVTFCLHDCYSDFWLSHYPDFLEKLRNLGRFRTLDEVSADVIRRNAKH